MDDVRAVLNQVVAADDRLRDAARRKSYTFEQRMALFDITQKLDAAVEALRDLLSCHDERSN